jgi:hypothetical protein
LAAAKGVEKVRTSVPEKLVHVTFDPQRTSVKELVKTINTKTEYRAREPKRARKTIPKKPKG